MAELFKQFATEEELNEFTNEVKNGMLTELGFDNLEGLQERLNQNPDDAVLAENLQLKDKMKELELNAEKGLMEFKRSISGKLGVNLFEEGALDTFLGNVKEQQSKLEAIQKDAQALMIEKTNVDVENRLLKSGLQFKRVDRAKSFVMADIASGKPVEQAIEDLVKEFPEWVSGVGAIGVNLKAENSTLTGREKYLKENGY